MADPAAFLIAQLLRRRDEVDATRLRLEIAAAARGAQLPLPGVEVRAARERARAVRRSRPYRAAGSPGDLAQGVRELETFVSEVGGARIEPPVVEGRDVFVALRARDEERYLLRISVEAYLVEAPSCHFVNAEGMRDDPAAWPDDAPGTPFRTPVFLCTRPVREYYVRHPEDPYGYGEGSLVAVVGTIFGALNAPEYAGRCGGAGRRPRRR
jgi:hypothetical protein